MDKKVFVVTGGNGLIGKEIINYLNQKGAITVNADIQARDGDRNNLHVDITSEQSVKDLIKQILDEHGKIDGWVNNAYPRTKDWGNKFEDVSMESWRANVDMHLNGYFLCCREVLAAMKKQGFGSVVNMSSIYGVQSPDFSLYENLNMTMPVAYSAIKGAIISLTKYLASYFGPFNLRINCISPGGIEDNQHVDFISRYKSKVPLGRMGLPSDIAPVVYFLLSEESKYITGQNLIVDGGFTRI